MVFTYEVVVMKIDNVNADDILGTANKGIYGSHHDEEKGFFKKLFGKKDDAESFFDKKVREIVFSYVLVKQLHGFYLLKDQQAMRFDVVISFDAKDRRAVYEEVVADVQKAFPDYTLQVAMDTDFSEE